MTIITPDTINTLAEKLNLLDLTDAERFVLDRLIERAGQFELEVSGFADEYNGLDDGSDLTNRAQTIARASGLLP